MAVFFVCLVTVPLLGASRYAVGRDARMAVGARCIPTGLRDRVLMRTMGLTPEIRRGRTRRSGA